MAFTTFAQEFFVANSQSNNFELIQKSHVPRALRFSCEGPPAKRSEKGYGDESGVKFKFYDEHHRLFPCKSQCPRGGGIGYANLTAGSFQIILKQWQYVSPFSFSSFSFPACLLPGQLCTLLVTAAQCPGFYAGSEFQCSRARLLARKINEKKKKDTCYFPSYGWFSEKWLIGARFRSVLEFIPVSVA